MLIEDCVPIDRKQTLLTDRCFKMQILNPAKNVTRLPVLLAELRFVAMYDQPANSKLDPILVRGLFFRGHTCGCFPVSGWILVGSFRGAKREIQPGDSAEQECDRACALRKCREEDRPH